MVSFQCSPLSTPDGIVGTFKQCAQFQMDKDLESFVSVVVLDEVGLAEDSPRMPLKVNELVLMSHLVCLSLLIPLAEDSCIRAFSYICRLTNSLQSLISKIFSSHDLLTTLMC